MYESNRDLALRAAGILGGDPLGRALKEVPGWNVVDVSNSCVPSFWAFLEPASTIEKSHYYLRCQAVARDMELVFTGASPEQRGLKPAEGIWRLDPK